MKIDQAYDLWAEIYDTNVNKTRDLEKHAAQTILAKYEFSSVLDLGCGTGKNSTWLSARAKKLLGVDFSQKMLQLAREKINGTHVGFLQADINKPWRFSEKKFDLVSCSLVLEHIKNLNFIFEQTRRALQIGGKFYLCELHPFKQYAGIKARFMRDGSLFELETHTHHITDYLAAAGKQHFKLLQLQEWFDDSNRSNLPRLIAFVFERTKDEN